MNSGRPTNIQFPLTSFQLVNQQKAAVSQFQTEREDDIVVQKKKKVGHMAPARVWIKSSWLIVVVRSPCAEAYRWRQ
jgi:hypothetical protein